MNPVHEFEEFEVTCKKCESTNIQMYVRMDFVVEIHCLDCENIENKY